MTTEFRPSHNVAYCMINHLYDRDVERQSHRGGRTLRRRDVDKYRQVSMYLYCCNGNVVKTFHQYDLPNDGVH